LIPTGATTGKSCTILPVMTKPNLPDHPAKSVQLSFSKLRTGFKAQEYRPDVLYQFNYTDLILARGDDSSSDLTDDLATPRDSLTADNVDNVEVPCPCVTIVIISKSPSDDGSGMNNSRWRDGRWNKAADNNGSPWSKDAFQKLIGNALELAGFPKYCINVRELDLSDSKYAKYFVKDANDQLTDGLSYEEAHNFVPKIRELLGADGTSRCFTICFVRMILKHIPKGIFGGLGTPAFTPYDPVEVPKGTPPSPFKPKVWTWPGTWKLKSMNFSFFQDTARVIEIAHEIFHQGGCTHAKDNLLYPGESIGEPDPTAIPKEAERPPDDLMNPVPKKTSKPTPADLQTLADYVKGNKCCDIKDPAGKPVKIRPA